MAVPNLWRTKKQRYRLQADVCPTCTSAVFPPRAVCPCCHQPMNAEQATSDGASVHAFVMPVLLPIQTSAVAAGDD